MSKLFKEGEESGLISVHGNPARIGDTIRYATTEGKLFEKLLWYDNKDFHCLMIGNLPYVQLFESAYIQPSKLHFEIVKEGEPVK